MESCHGNDHHAVTSKNGVDNRRSSIKSKQLLNNNDVNDVILSTVPDDASRHSISFNDVTKGRRNGHVVSFDETGDEETPSPNDVLLKVRLASNSRIPSPGVSHSGLTMRFYRSRR